MLWILRIHCRYIPVVLYCFNKFIKVVVVIIIIVIIIMIIITIKVDIFIQKIYIMYYII